MTAVDADRNLLFGVLALQAELIEPGQFAEICTAWAVRKDRPIADLLADRGWISAEDRSLLEPLLERRLRKHEGDPHKSLVAAASANPDVLAALQSMPDEGVRTSLADVTCERGHSKPLEYLSLIGRPPESRDRYTLTTLHATGGIGRVWLARDNDMDREIALKELRPERSDDASILQRFFQEARITGRLDHPGVVPVHELARGEGGRNGGRPYYTMRFVRGRTLSEAVADYHGQLAAGTARRSDLLALIQAFVGVANTVAFAHSRGVIHRDLKGANIILGEFGEVILLDWGLAKLVDRDGVRERSEPAFDPGATAPYSGATDGSGADLTAAGQVLGTPAYMAPEQARGLTGQVDRRTDVYGLGAILYEILAGKPPFGGESIQEVLRKVREEPPPRPRSISRSAPRPLEAICLKAMAKDPEGRYATAAAMAADVQHWLADEPVAAWREPFPIRARRWVVRHRTQVAAGVAAMAVAVVGLVAAVAVQARANRELSESLAREKLALKDADAQSSQAEEAIQSFYRGISEDVILRRPELEQLRRGLLETALRFYDKRVKYLTDEHKGGVRELRSIVAGLERLASLQAMLGDRDTAIRTRLRIVELHDANPQLVPDGSAQALLALGELQRLAGRPDDAVRSLRDALDRFERLNYQTMVALVQTDLGRLLFDMGKAEEGRLLLERARATEEEYAADGHPTPNRPDIYTTLANLHDAEGRRMEALGFYEKAAAIYEDLVSRRPTAYTQAELARTLNNLGLARAKSGELAEGRRDVERGKGIREKLLAGQPLNIDPRADLARSYYHLARIQLLSGAPAEAGASIRKAEELYTGIPPKGPEDIYFQACMKALHAGLRGEGKAEEALSAADRAARQRAADEAVGLLKQAAAAGYANPMRFRNDTPLDSLRSRPDFQELLRSLGQPPK